tara:strand:- start:962 stop:1159 length:198 start_codon:yes stop_codon:yes gene_type:complete
MQNLKNTLRNIAEIATDAQHNNEAADVYSWDAYEACKRILQQMQNYGYNVEEMLAEIAENNSVYK